MKRFLLAAFLLCGFTAPEWDDELSRQRYQSLIHEVRCPTCQNSNIAESNAPLARQLRELVAEQIRQGRSDGEIRQHLLQRYGDFISYQPPLRGSTLLLWLSPLLLMAWLFRTVWRRQRQSKRLILPELNLNVRPEALPSRWLYLWAALLLTTAAAFWWTQSESWRRWQAMRLSLDDSLQQALQVHRFPDFQQLEFPPLFCQAMQAALNSGDARGAQAVGQCYQMSEMNAWASQALRYALRLQPHNLRLKAHYVQHELFSQPQQALSVENERFLRELMLAEPDVLMHRILLAAAYEKANRAAEALPLWESLARKTEDAELERYIQQRLQAARWQLPIGIHLCEGDWPAEALLFVSVARQERPKPPLMARVLPLLPQQEALFTAADSMLTTAEALPEKHLKITAFVSANGRVDGQRLAQLERDMDELAPLQLELCR